MISLLQLLLQKSMEENRLDLPSFPAPNTNLVGRRFKSVSIHLFSLSAGYFNAYGFAAQNTSADAFIHLGDYVCPYSKTHNSLGCSH
jgi:phosphodiesterase/alkaline phosphatase D-like protein